MGRAIARAALALLIAVSVGCGSTQTERRSEARTLESGSGLTRERAIAIAQRNLPDPFTHGVLYPPTDALPDGAYGVLRTVTSVARRVEGGWLVAFAFRCPDDPARGRIVRVEDAGRARLLYPPVHLPSMEPASPNDRALVARPIEPVLGAVHPEAVGDWSAGEAPPGLPDDGAIYVGPRRFIYDGRTVVMPTFGRMRAWQWAPEDDVERFEATWAGDVLQVRYTVDIVEPLARFREGRFESLPHADVPAWPMVRGSGRIPAEHIDASGPMFRPRPVHYYGMPTNSGPIEVRCSTADRCASSLRSPAEWICAELGSAR